MQVPPADRFRPESSPAAPPRRWAAVEGTSFDLYVPEGEDWEPDAASLAFAEVVLAALDEVVAQAVAHVRRYVDAERVGLGGELSLTGVYCDAPRQRVEVSFTWESAPYTLWTVTFAWDGEGRRSAIGLSVRPW